MSLLVGILQAGSNNHLTSSEEANAVATDFVTPGIIGSFSNTSGVAPQTGAFAVNAQGSPNMTVSVSAGVAYANGTPSAQNAQVLRVKNTATATVTISSNSSGSTKYDWLYINLDASNMANPAVGADNVATLITSRSSSASTDNGTPPAFGLLLEIITVANGASSISNGNISDSRSNAIITQANTSISTGWNNLAALPSAVTANGNRSYSLTYGADQSGTVAPGMRLRTTRTVSAPTQCTSLNGTTQYYSKTSPAGMTFTDDFVAGGWVKLFAYSASNQVIISRYNGTSGWKLQISPSGQLQLVGINAGSANFSSVLSYQSIPLNKWVHVAAQLDMSSFTATPTTSYTMIDGVDVSAQVTRGGTNPTALIQAGNLEVATANTIEFFGGKIAQTFVTNAKVTEATILASMHQTLAGTETSFISAYSFNNSINDLNTSNANNLTANGSAVATNTDSPFGGQAGGLIDPKLDYAIIQKVTSTTVTVQVAEGCTIPTSGGVSAVVYSSNKAPYGMPAQRTKWTIDLINNAPQTQTSPATGTLYNVGALVLQSPIGEWNGSWKSTPYGVKGSAAQINIFTAVAATSVTTANIIQGSSGVMYGDAPADRMTSIFSTFVLSNSIQTPLYPILYTGVASLISIAIRGDFSDGTTGQNVTGDILRLENAYL